MPKNSVILELGPGDSVVSALLGFSKGASITYLVDVGSFARTDIAFYRNFVNSMKKSGAPIPEIEWTNTTFTDVLECCNGRYLTSGIDSLRTIPSKSVDFIWSHSVLEHVRKHDLKELLNELQRILKPGSFSSHNIDYQDHLSHSLNNLRFPNSIWESSFFIKSGFYTNRINAIKMHEMFKNAGFTILREEFGRWPFLPISRSALHKDFQLLADDELRIRTSHVLLKAPTSVKYYDPS
jgi:SAM-dependent methyltransferase